MRCANTISTFFRRWRDRSYSGVSAIALATSRHPRSDLGGSYGKSYSDSTAASARRLAVVLAGAVKPRALTGDACARRLVAAPELHQPFASRAGVFIRVRIEHEVGARESAVRLVGLIEHRNMRRDLPFLDQPGEVRCRSVGAVGGQIRRLQAEAVPCPVNYGARGSTSACRIARVASTSRMTPWSVSIR